jgi:hypothetical protein
MVEVMARIANGDLVVVIPGILGSTLRARFPANLGISADRAQPARAPASRLAGRDRPPGRPVAPVG